MRGLSEKIHRICCKLGLRTVFRSHKTLRQQLIQVKAHIPEEDRKGVVYEVPCTDCDHTYIGETGRTLRKRLTEHKAAVRRQDQNNGIAVHAWRINHRPDWESASVKTTAKHYWKRRILEALFIQSKDLQ